MDKLIVSCVLLVCLHAFLPSCEGFTGVNANRGYVFTAPRRFLAGEIESGCLSLHNLEPPAHVVLELLSPSTTKDEVLASTSNVIQTGIETCLELVVPRTENFKARLRLKITFDKYPDYVVETEKEVYIEHDSLITFVETDKPVYKPGQDVNIRVLMLKHDLKPWKKTIPKVWIENPSEIRVAQWTNVSTENGMVQLKFPLSPEPSPGTWKVKVEKNKSQPQLVHTTMFEVKKYVLPRFQMTITSPGYILADAENVTWNICAKYSYGKPVKGTLLLKSTPQTPMWRRKSNLPEIHYETELDSPDGCTEFVLSGAVLGLAHWKVAPNNIVLIANFTEAGTGIVETTTSRTVVVHQALKLEFLPYTPKYFKLGLPYHGKLRVSRHDDTPAPHEKIQLCLRVRGKDEWLRVVVECRNFTSSSDGFVDFIVPLSHRNIVLLSFVATGIDYPTKYYSPDTRWRVFMDQPSAHIDVSPWYSPSDSYLAITRGYQPIVCGEKYSFNVMYTVPAKSKTNESISFHYSINSKGDLLIYGHVKHRPTRDTVLNYSEFRNLLGAVETPGNKTTQDTIVHRFPLSVKITPSMAPISELLLYYVRSDGEIVATTYSIEVGHCFENKVKSAWHTDAQTPGTATLYHVEAAPWSLCGISAVDKSTLFLGGSKSNLIDAERSFEQLKRFHIEPETRPIWTWTHCKATTQHESNTEEVDHLPIPALRALPVWSPLRSRRTTILHDWKSHGDVNYVDAVQAFDDFGAIVMSDLILETRPCPQFFWQARDFIGVHNLVLRAGMEAPEPAILNKAMRTLPMAVPLLNLSPEQSYVDSIPDQPATLRSYFPETWLWELMPTGKEGKVTIERILPDTITDWVGYTTCISPTHGLGVAPPTGITGFQPFFLDYSLPYSVKRGELLRMKVSLFNYMQHSLPVKIKLEDATGLDLHLSHAVASFCVKPRDSVVHEYILRPRVLGDVNITVSASIDSDYAEPCGPETLLYTQDVIVKPILVLPEGFPVEMTKSAFICPKDFSDDSTIIWDLDLPEDLVPESARAYVSLIGDILGPALENLDSLVRLPLGCGEQNMILFVPNIHVIGYLDATGVENSELRARAVKNMEKGYQRELIYRHPDGSYSAFGPESSESSIWLTAFVIKSFAQARSIIHIDERDLKVSVKWMMKKQLENGCFPVIGRVFHKDMKGGLQDDDSSSTALTAYILISLLKSGVPLTPSLINNALHCLEKGMANGGDTIYTAALSTYALALLEHPKANNSLKLLMDRATRNHDLLWWEDKYKPSLGLSIEMTAYAVLSFVKLGGEANMVEALKAVRWMSKQRNAEGGFTSTQDTVLGLEALTKYAAAMSSNNTDLSVLVTAGDVDQVYRMHNDNRMVLTQIRLPILPTTVEIFAEGEGCVLVQSNIKYNVAHATGSEAFDLSVGATSVLASVDECSMQKITICTRYKLADGESNMALLEIGMISGYVPDRTSLHSLLEDPATKVKRFEEDRDIVSIYFDKLINQKTCISLIVTRENIVDRLEPANVKLYDYYQQELTISSSYSFAQTCSSANPSEEAEIPNPVPVEVEQPEKDNGNNSDKEKIIEKVAKNGVLEVIQKVRKGVVEETSNSSQKPASEEDLVEQLRDKVTVAKPTLITGIQSKYENVPLVENSNLKINTDDISSVANVRTANNNSIVFDNVDVPQPEVGSGQTPDEPDINLNPVFDRLEPPSTNLEDIEKLSVFNKQDQDADFDGNPNFVVVEHELATPDGIEGPTPIYVKPEIKNIDNESLQDTINRTVLTEEANSSKSLSQSTSAFTSNGSCPVCSDELPIDLYEFYCSTNSVVKAAIRRLRKARLLLDISPLQPVKRLRSTITFVLDPDCSCSPLDTPGGLALIIHQADSEFGKRSSQYILNEFVSIYGLQPVSGVPQEITDARLTCTK